jgi:phenylacetate-CoA ligase
MRNGHLSQIKFRELQYLKLKKLVKHAYQNVNYYRKLFDAAGITPSDIRTIEDIRKIPVTTRLDIRRATIPGMIAKNADINRCIRYTTSGTTNEALEIYISKDEEALQSTLHLRMLFAHGYKPNHKVVILTHPQFIFNKKKKFIFQHLGIFDIEYLSIFCTPKEHLDRLLKIKPGIIKGYTSIIKAIAQEIKTRDIKEIHPHLVLCTAEFLREEDRKFLSDTFKAKVIDYYSSAECGLIAWECRKHSGYHINSDNLILELINNSDKATEKQKGEVVITNLNSYTMPFIRYKIGDSVILNDTLCPCGNKLPLIKTIIERTENKQSTK